jgi:hypothetical protein
MEPINPYDYVNEINGKHTDIMSGTENDELAEKSYVPFLTNRALSYHADTVMYANEMNLNHHIDNKFQFHYFINSIRPRKRFAKWAKKRDNSDLEAVKEYYGYNDVKAESALELLSLEQLNVIKERLNKGGSG